LIAVILLAHDREMENSKEALLSTAAKNDNIEQALRGKKGLVRYRRAATAA